MSVKGFNVHDNMYELMFKYKNLITFRRFCRRSKYKHSSENNRLSGKHRGKYTYLKSIPLILIKNIKSK